MAVIFSIAYLNIFPPQLRMSPFSSQINLIKPGPSIFWKPTTRRCDDARRSPTAGRTTLLGQFHFLMALCLWWIQNVGPEWAFWDWCCAWLPHRLVCLKSAMDARNWNHSTVSLKSRRLHCVTLKLIDRFAEGGVVGRRRRVDAALINRCDGSSTEGRPIWLIRCFRQYQCRFYRVDFV